MATAKSALDYIEDEHIHFCEWETAGGPCHKPQPLNLLREIVFYDGKPTLVCANHYKKWEMESGLYMKHIRVC
jgi:hypothetical protein